MRTKDDQKKEALFKATIKLVNEIGFAASSVSKIAGEANVSPSTIYVFFKNKEALLVSTYLEKKHNLAETLLDDFDGSLPIRDIISAFLFNPVSRLANPRLCHGLEMDAANLENAFGMAWDAIKR